MPRSILFTLRATVCVSLVLPGCFSPAASAADEQRRLKVTFLGLCDEHVKIVEHQARTDRREGRAFYWDSYVVRALCVAYDMTGNEKYLDVCKRWSDRMLDYQSRMIPKGAYYMQYGRAPGQDKGYWYAADCSSIAMGVLATAARCDDPKEKARYLDSVKAFAKLVIDNWVRPSGGVTDGYWPKSDKEWWCSTGVFGSLAFQLYDATGDESYLKVGLDAIDWLNQIDFLTVAVHYPPKQIKPAVMMYCLEAYSAAFPYLQPGTERYKAAMAQWAKALDWITHNQGGRASVGYMTQWGSKLGGLPCHMYIYAAHVPGNEKVAEAADTELEYILGLLKMSPDAPHQDQLALFAMISCAEKLRPGILYRDGKKTADTGQPSPIVRERRPGRETPEE